MEKKDNCRQFQCIYLSFLRLAVAASAAEAAQADDVLRQEGASVSLNVTSQAVPITLLKTKTPFKNSSK